MFKFEDLKSILLEITNNCQAKCPMCSRNVHGGLKNPLLRLNSWSLDDFKNIISIEVLNIIDSICFSGNFGDPSLNDNLINMCEYVKSVNPAIYISIQTNGSARKESWWKDLYNALPTNHLVHFALDGLEDTHELYRIDTTYGNVIRNAVAFINAGGNAEWFFIKFKHNEHQLEECRSKSKQLGFKQFNVISSSRFLGDPTFNVLDKHGNLTHILEPPTDNTLTFISKDVLDSYQKIVNEAEISCMVKRKKEIYIDAHMTLLPCSWVSSIPFNYFDKDGIVPILLIDEIRKQYNNLLIDLGGKDSIDSRLGIRKVIETDKWQNVWKKYWNDEKFIMCARTCGKFKENIFSPPSH